MGRTRFDDRTRRLAGGASRRGLLKGLAGENDFAPVVGHRFRVGSTEGACRDAVMEGEAVAVEPYRLLAFTWRGGAMKRPVTVTFTLEPDGDGVRLNLTRSHENRAACATTRRLFGRDWTKTILGETLPRYLKGQEPD